MVSITVQVGEVLIEFTSFQQWVNKAKSWFRNLGMSSCQYICLDNVGRVCTCGKQFMQADREGTFPIRVYAIEDAPQDILEGVAVQQATGKS
jgi:hypothetical protein